MDAPRLFACRPGMEPALLRELATELPRSHHRKVEGADGVVLSTLDPEERTRVACVAFSQQVLEDARAVGAPSVAGWADLLAGAVMDALTAHEGPWRLHVWAHDVPGAPVKPGRVRLVVDGVTEHLRRRQKRLLKTQVDVRAPWQPGEKLVQLLLVGPQSGYLSVVDVEGSPQLRRLLVHAPGGVVPVEDDKRPPSRAFKKLREALWHMDAAFERGQTVVDLGACPGGWTFVAVEGGARVTAVDRSELAPELMRHPDVTFVAADAFAWKPAAPVDWLICDVIAFPQRTQELLQAWTSQRWCRQLCVTVKFRGDEHYAVLEQVKALMARHSADFVVRQLTHNKNECTVMARLG